MGVMCTATITGPNAADIALQSLAMVTELEKIWSRFIPTSDISMLNNAGGAAVWVDPRTALLIRYMQAAHTATHGAFNPTLLPLQLRAGDGQSLVDDLETTIPTTSHVFQSLDGITFFSDGRVRLAPDMTLDAGGIAKGLAADLILAEAQKHGAVRACINLGGDMAMSSTSDESWPVNILDPQNPARTIAKVHIRSGAVATSTLSARHRGASGITSHVFTLNGPQKADTVTGASVIASTAVWAEAWTKFLLTTNSQNSLQVLDEQNLAAQLIFADGRIATTNSWESFTS
jgi:thiamine biosynthesis lipoprotein